MAARQSLKRALRVISELLDGKTVDINRARTLMKVEYHAASTTLTAITDGLGPARVRKFKSQGRVRYALQGVRYGEPTHEVAIAACYGAALAPLFEGTGLENRLASALTYVVDASPNPEAFCNFDRKFIFVRGGGERSLPTNAKHLDRITDAVIRQRWIRLHYRGFDGTCEKLKVKPLTMAVYDHQLYVLAEHDEEVRALRFSRIENVRKTNQEFDYPQDYSTSSLFKDVFGIFIRGEDPPQRVTLILAERWAAYAKTHAWHRSQELRDSDNGTIEITLTVRICPELKSWILSFGSEARVIAPVTLRNEITEMFHDAAKAYGPPQPKSG